MARFAELMERIRINGSMHSVSRNFVLALMNSVAEATMDQMIQDPERKPAKNIDADLEQ